jgi:hypothetical protein
MWARERNTSCSGKQQSGCVILRNGACSENRSQRIKKACRPRNDAIQKTENKGQKEGAVIQTNSADLCGIVMRGL